MVTNEEIVYLDNNATTELDPAVVEEMLPFLTKFYGNPSSGYQFGGQARSAIEHSAVRRHCEELAKRGCEVTFLPVDENGDVDLAEVEKAIRPNTALVSVMWANNETGVLFPVEKLAEICRDKRVLFHTDAVQAVGKIPIRLRDSAINFLSLSAHKLH